jgi:hypothetical protein
MQHFTQIQIYPFSVLFYSFTRFYPSSQKEIPLNAVAFRGMVRRNRGEEGEMGGGGKGSGNGTPQAAAHLPPVSSGGLHHSAANAVSKRNLLPVPAGP